MANAKDRQSHFLRDDPSVITMIAAITLCASRSNPPLPDPQRKGEGHGTLCARSLKHLGPTLVFVMGCWWFDSYCYSQLTKLSLFLVGAPPTLGNLAHMARPYFLPRRLGQMDELVTNRITELVASIIIRSPLSLHPIKLVKIGAKNGFTKLIRHFSKVVCVPYVSAAIYSPAKT